MRPLRQAQALARLQRWYRLPRPELERVMDGRLRVTLESARSSVPYYRERVARELDQALAGHRASEGLAHLPVTTKADIKREGVQAFRREGVNPEVCHLVRTSGSTGIPLEVLRSPRERAEQVALWIRTLRVNGYSPRHKVLALAAPGREGEGRSLLQAFGWLRREVAHYQKPPEEVVDRLLDYRPHVLYGNRHQLELVCLELRRRGRVYDSLRLLISSGFPLRENSRLLFREHLGIDAVNSYGSEETGVLAHETPQGQGLRLCEELTFVEFLDEGGLPLPPHTSGRIVVTTLNRRVQPFIRYELGDRVRFRVVTDSSGSRWRKIEAIEGRDDDFLVLPDGSRKFCPEFYDVFTRFPRLDQGRAVQKTRTLVELQLVGDPGYIQEHREGILGYLRRRYPEEMEFRIVTLDRLPPDPSGKIRIVVSELDASSAPEAEPGSPPP